MRRLRFLLTTMPGFVFLMVNLAVAQSYTVTDLGTFGGTFSQGQAINTAGQVTGIANTAGDAAFHEFLYSGGVMTD